MAVSRTKAGLGAGALLAIALAGAFVKPLEAPGGQPVLRGYADPIGIPTDCWGNIQGAELGKSRTTAECEALLDEDILEARALVAECVPGPKTSYQEAALISFAFNVGRGKPGVKDGICVLRNGNQPRIRRFANAGNWAAACAEFDSWTKAGGLVFAGLVNRRAQERALCEGRL